MLRKLRHYKYQLMDDYPISITIKLDQDIDTPFINMSKEGNLLIKRRYSWNRPNGPMIDTKTFMRGSLVHDALYQLMREKHLDLSNRDSADKLLKELCVADGYGKSGPGMCIGVCTGSVKAAPNHNPTLKINWFTHPDP